MKLAKEAKIGIFFVAGIMLFGLLLEAGSRFDLFDRSIPYKTYLLSSTGLKTGDAVKLAGVEIGTISDITILDDKVRVDFKVKPGTKIRQDTVAGIRMTSMLGGQYLGLTFGTPGVPELPAGSTVRSSESTGVDALLENIGSLTKDAKEMILSLNRNQNEVMSRITAMLDENRLAVRDSLHGLASITTKFDRGEGSLAMLLNDKTLYNNATAMTGSLKQVSARLERGEGTLGKLMKEDEIYNNANSAMKSFNQVAQRINRGEGTAGKLLTDSVLYDELRVTMSNMKDITRKINEGQGTIGKLVNDDKLYLDATATLKKAEKAMEGLQDTGPISVIGSVIGTLF